MKILNVNTAKKNIRKVKVGKDVKIFDFVNLYECSIGDRTQIGAFVEIQKGAKVGKRCRIQSHTFICEGVTIEDEVFIGHGVIFINDKKPSVRKTLDKSWTLEPILIKDGATIGSGAILMGGITVGKGAFVGAGAVVTKDVADHGTVVGVPARPYRG
ncbi:MAG: N-acetyltransferase [Candidatus Omnitrophica bacterium]|nr:N-acetyltransferase [Candidatus Omnitrophota bacterium]